MTRSGVFDRIVCGIDGTPESLEAVRQARALACEDSTLCLFHAVDLAPALAVAWAAPAAASSMTIGAREALDEAAELVPGASTRSVDGPPVACLLEEIEREGATLVAVGTHGTPRAEGILLGATTTRMLHEAPCSVLVTRAPDEGDFVPRSIVVGVDGSDESACAAAAALEIGSRLGASVAGLTALGGKDVHLDTARTLVPDLRVEDRSPVDALVAGAEGVDLVVVGSRGLHGLRSLGSVSERVAHRARCSVLVVRGSR
jgi:nucleotide-binding universal stress UspA family protein